MSLHEFKSSHGVLAYDRRGMGEPLVLVHGLYPGASHDEYAHNVGALQQHFTVYSLNLLGFGQSDVPRITHTAEMHQHMLRDFVADVVGEPSHLLASGMSCGIATRFGVYDDPLLKRLILINPPAQQTYKDHPGLADRLANFVLGTLSAGFSIYEVEASDEGIEFWVKDNYHDPHKWIKEKMKLLLVEANEHNKMMAHISLLCGYFDVDLKQMIRNIRSMTQVICGSDLPAPPIAEWFRPAQWSMGKRLDIVPESKSFPHEEQSAIVNQLMIDFLSGRLNGQ